LGSPNIFADIYFQSLISLTFLSAVHLQATRENLHVVIVLIVLAYISRTFNLILNTRILPVCSTDESLVTALIYCLEEIKS